MLLERRPRFSLFDVAYFFLQLQNKVMKSKIFIENKPASLPVDHINNKISPGDEANKDGDFIIVYSGTMTITAAFDFLIPTSPFAYDPTQGNLLTDVVVTSSSGADVNFEGTKDPVTSRAYNVGGTGSPTVNKDYGLVTLFGIASSPKPSSAVSLQSSGW